MQRIVPQRPHCRRCGAVVERRHRCPRCGKRSWAWLFGSNPPWIRH